MARQSRILEHCAACGPAESISLGEVCSGISGKQILKNGVRESGRQMLTLPLRQSLLLPPPPQALITSYCLILGAPAPSLYADAYFPG